LEKFCEEEGGPNSRKGSPSFYEKFPGREVSSQQKRGWLCYGKERKKKEFLGKKK